MSDPPTDVSHFQENLVGQLALDGEVERINHVRPEARIQSFAGGRRDAVNAWEGRLRKRLRRGRNRSNVAIRSNAKCICGGQSRAASRHSASSIHIVIAALDRLDKPGSQQRHEYEVHAVESSIDAAVAATNDSSVAPKCLAQEALGNVGVPGRGEAGAE